MTFLGVEGMILYKFIVVNQDCRITLMYQGHIRETSPQTYQTFQFKERVEHSPGFHKVVTIHCDDLTLWIWYLMGSVCVSKTEATAVIL